MSTLLWVIGVLSHAEILARETVIHTNGENVRDRREGGERTNEGWQREKVRRWRGKIRRRSIKGTEMKSRERREKAGKGNGVNSQLIYRGWRGRGWRCGLNKWEEALRSGCVWVSSKGQIRSVGFCGFINTKSLFIVQPLWAFSGLQAKSMSSPLTCSATYPSRLVWCELPGMPAAEMSVVSSWCQKQQKQKYIYITLQLHKPQFYLVSSHRNDLDRQIAVKLRGKIGIVDFLG